MNKRLLYLLIVLSAAVLAALCISVTALAAPDVIYSTDAGNNSSLIAVSNPDSVSSSTFDHTYVISGYGNEGVTVYLYIGDGSGTYYLQKVDGVAVSWKIGASGLFMRQIKLNKGVNRILLRAEDGNGNYQIIKRNITQLTQNFLDIIKSFSFNIMNVK